MIMPGQTTCDSRLDSRLMLQQHGEEGGVSLAFRVRRLLKGARLPGIHEVSGGHDSLPFPWILVQIRGRAETLEC